MKIKIINFKLRMVDKALRFLIRLEEKLVNLFEPVLDDDEVSEYRAIVERHKKEMEGEA